jgi:hypothetical protein
MLATSMGRKPAPKKKKSAQRARPSSTRVKRATSPPPQPPSAPKTVAPAPKAPAPVAKAAAPAADLKPAPPPAFGNIPWGYGDNRITAMARDPQWIFAYWEITDEGIAAARGKIGDFQAGCALRVYDTTHRLFDGLNAHGHWDIGVDRAANQYYLHVGRPGATFHVDIGVRGSGGAFAPIVRSSAVEMPRDSISPNTRVEWSTVLRSGPASSYRHRYVPKPGAPPPPPAAGPEPGPPADLEKVFQDLSGEGWTRTEWTETLMDSRVVRWVRWTGPFLPDRLPIAPAGTFKHVEVLYQGERRVVRVEGGERFVYGPWRVTLEAVGLKGERRTIHQWMVRHRWTTEEGTVRVETPAILTRILGGQRFTLQQSGSDQRMTGDVWGSEVLQLGASERRWIGGSETLLAGASETLLLGASETLHLGATEILAGGASEARWGGASELHLIGGSETIWGLGASEGMP